MKRIAWIGAALFFPWVLEAQVDATLRIPPKAEALGAADRLRGESLDPIEVRWNPVTGRARSLDGRFILPGEASPEEECLGFLAREPKLFGWDPGVELRLSSEREGMGTRHLRFQALLRGIPVGRSEIAFHLEGFGSEGYVPAITSLSSEEGYSEASRILADWPGDLFVPRFSEGEAIEIAEGAVSPRRSLRGESRAALEISTTPPPGCLVFTVWVSSIEPRGLFRVRIDARTGEPLAAEDRLRYGEKAAVDGTGKVFLVNPIVALKDITLKDMDDSAGAVPPAAYSQVTLKDLDGSGFLVGPYVTTRNTPRATRSVRQNFSYLRDYDGFEEVMAYYHIDSVQRFIQSLGFKDIYNRQIAVYANSEPPGIPYTEAQAYYQPKGDGSGTGEIAFGSGGTDAAEDPEVIIHEYGHAIQDNQVPGYGETFESWSIGEGWSDWLSSAYLAAYSDGFGDICEGEWMAAGIPVGPGEEPIQCFRKLDSTKHYPEDLVGEPHSDGELWSSSLWRVFQTLGRVDSLKLVLQSNFYLGTGPSFEDGAMAVLRADRGLFTGSHEDFLRQVFTDRGFLMPPFNLTWFFTAKPSPQLSLPADGSLVSTKIRILRPGTVRGSGGKTIEVYVNIVHPQPSYVGVALRTPQGTDVALNPVAARTVPGGPVIYGLSLAPWEALDGIEGEPASGVWTLFLENGSGEAGYLVEWGVRFPGFVRGDANEDGSINISDALGILGYLFQGGKLSCLKSADVNDDGRLNLIDGIALLRHIMGLGPPPPEPFPKSGEDLTPDGLTCGG